MAGLIEPTSSYWRDKRIFVTGATGFVGSWVCAALLEQDAAVVALVRDADWRSEFYRSKAYWRTAIVHGQLEDYACLERAVAEHELDTVIHLGAQTQVGTALRSPHATLEANIRGTYNLLEVCRVHADLVKRIVIASSDKAYGDMRSTAYTEDAPLAAQHPYDVSKACADLLAQSYARTYALPVAIARCGNIFGGGDLNWNRLVPGTIRSLWRNERPLVRSDGTFTRDYLYVRDAADAYLRLARFADGEGVAGTAVNFGGGTPRTVLEMIGCIAKLMNKPELEPVIQNTATAEIRHQVLSSSRAESRLGWWPRYSLESALRETIDWYTTFLDSEN